MTYRDLKSWLDQMTEEELDRQLTPYILMEAVERPMAKEYEDMLAWLSIFAPADWLRDEALKLLILMNVPIRG